MSDDERAFLDAIGAASRQVPPMSNDPEAVLRSGRRRESTRRAVQVTGVLAVTAALAVGVTQVLPDRDAATAPVATTSATPSPTVSSPPTPAASQTALPTSPASPVDVPDEVLLLPAALDAPESPRQLVDDVAPWYLPAGCDVGQPVTAVAMRGQRLGTGEFEAVVPVQQVATFPDAAAAVAEMDRVRAVLAACAPQSSDTQTRYLREDVAVGAQGTGLATSYYGGADDGSLGTYVVLTRRGNAIALVGGEGGERDLGEARAQETAHAQAAWELLSRFALPDS